MDLVLFCLCISFANVLRPAVPVLNVFLCLRCGLLSKIELQHLSMLKVVNRIRVFNVIYITLSFHISMIFKRIPRKPEFSIHNQHHQYYFYLYK